MASKSAAPRMQTVSFLSKTARTSMSTKILTKPPQIMLEPRTVYTLRATPNTILAITPPTRRTAVLSFSDEYSAYEFGRLLEAHRAATKEWPDLSKGKMHLYDGGSRGLSIIDVIEWDISDLKQICATRYMNMILVDDFLTRKNLQGVYIALDAETDALADHLNFLWGHSG
jgi:hypothetical protein